MRRGDDSGGDMGEELALLLILLAGGGLAVWGVMRAANASAPGALDPAAAGSSPGGSAGGSIPPVYDPSPSTTWPTQPPAPAPLPFPPPSSVSMVDAGNAHDIDILARTIYGEARGDGAQGMQAVANVVMNRLHAGTFGVSVAGICLAPGQFSSWNSNDKNRTTILTVTDSNSVFRTAQSIATQAVAGTLPDITNGATYFYAPAGMAGGRAPSWAAAMMVTAHIGHQIFLKPAMVS